MTNSQKKANRDLYGSLEFRNYLNGNDNSEKKLTKEEKNPMFDMDSATLRDEES